MLTNFENITYDLSEDEIILAKDFCVSFQKYSKDNPIKAPEIVAKVNANKITKARFTEARLRKICNYIRSNGMIPLIATSNGYYVDYSREALESQIRSLTERSNSILRCADGLKKFLTTK